ncbi:hypothetical protein C1O30_21125 [Dickeya zeae]|nr:hypothetical protein C1O30_21125 [Dickeya zeae]
MFGESGFTHGDLLNGHNQYVGRSLKVNGSVYRDTYTSTTPVLVPVRKPCRGSAPLRLFACRELA